MALSWRTFASRIRLDGEPQPHPPAHIARLEPYRCVSSRDQISEKGTDDAYKLDWNESTIAPSPRVAEALNEAITAGRFEWYPELGAQQLTAALEEYTGVPKESLIVTNGSDDALLLLARTFLRASTEVIVPVPTYTHFLVYAGAQNARIQKIRWPDPFQKSVRTLERSISSTTRMVYLVSPNNPTGTVWSAEEVERLCSRHPHTMFIVDEAYHEFSGETVIHLTQKYANLAVTRTFSKAFGLAAFRVGYVAAHPRIADHLWRLHNPKSVNHFAQVAALAAVKDQDYLQSYVDEVRKARAEFTDRLNDLDVEVHETPANYVVVRVQRPKKLATALADKNIYVRDRSTMPGMAGCVRVTIGTCEQMQIVGDKFIEALKETGCI
jgi:histidinol-phosphate aminotransferase